MEDIPEDFKQIYENIMQQEEITAREFIIRAIPEISAEGTSRNIFLDVKNLEISGLETDEVYQAKKCVISFSLPKGSYATTVIEFLCETAPVAPKSETTMCP